MLELLLNYFTLLIAGVLLVGLVIYAVKHKQMSGIQKNLIFISIGLLILYFTFILVLTVGFGNNHPMGEPMPISS